MTNDKIHQFNHDRHTKLFTEYSANPKICKCCGDTLPYNKRSQIFCNSSCFATYSNKVCIKNPTGINGSSKIGISRKTLTCINCNKSLVESCGRKYCSSECHKDHQFKTVTSPRVESGMCTKPSTVKQYLFKTRGEICEICGQGNIWNGKPLMLQIDHIDGNSDNNKLDNVRVICAHCHSQTETYTGRNIKNTKRNSYLKKYKKSALTYEEK